MPYEFEQQPITADAHNHTITGRDQNGVIVEIRVSQNIETEAEADATFLDLMEYMQGWSRIDSNGWGGGKSKPVGFLMVEV